MDLEQWIYQKIINLTAEKDQIMQWAKLYPDISKLLTGASTNINKAMKDLNGALEIIEKK